MSHRESSGWSDFRPESGAGGPAPDDATGDGYHRARHSHAAPAPYVEHPQPYPDGYAGAAVDPDAPTGAYPRVDDGRYGYGRPGPFDDGGYHDGYARHSVPGRPDDDPHRYGPQPSYGGEGAAWPGGYGVAPDRAAAHESPHWDGPDDTGWERDAAHGPGWDRDAAHDGPGWDRDAAHDGPGWDGSGHAGWDRGAAHHDPAQDRPDDAGWGGEPAARPAWDDSTAVHSPVVGADQPAPRKSRAGRNLPAAIGVGVGLGGLVVASLFVWTPAFLAVLIIAAGIGTWEMVRALHAGKVHPPLVPLLASVPLLAGLAWFRGPVALVPGLFAVVVATMVWRLADGPRGYSRDVAGAVLIIVYVPFLASFAAMLAAAPDGAWRVLVTLAGVVLSDTGGYIAGVLLGRHKMAPKISPGKTWEGLAGSLVATAVGGVFLLHYLLDTGWWQGAVFGLFVSAAAVVGDLAESMIKRDLGIKDMGRLLPGHGGLMDRLDSILIAAPTAYVLLSALAPGHT